MNAENQSLNQSESYRQDDDEISLLDLLQIIADNLRLLVLAPLVIGLAALGGSFFITPSFTASTQFLPPQAQQSAAASMLQSLGALGGLAGAAGGIKSPADQYVAFLKSRAVQDALIKSLDLNIYYETELLEDARRILQSKTTISAGKDGLISIKFDDKDPKLAAQVANAYVEELSNLMSRLSITEAQQRRAFFEKQLHSTKEKLVAAEQALAGSGVSVSALNTNPEAALEGPSRLRAQVTAQEVKLASMRTYLTETAPQFKQALNELAALRSQLTKAEKDQIKGSATGGSDYVSRFREFKYQETLFELFARQYELAKVDESKEGAVIQVIDVATPPERKSQPKKALIAIAAAVGSGFVLLFFVFVRHILFAGPQDPESAAKIANLQRSWRRALGRA